MTASSLVTLAALLLAILLLLAGALVWQEARRRPGPAETAYVIDEAVSYISERLPADLRRRLAGGGVRRIVEWEVYLLQGLAQPQRWRPVETVAGGTEASIDFIVDRIATVHGATYDRGDVAEVLRLEAEYLVMIGAVGEAVDREELGRPGRDGPEDGEREEGEEE